MNKKFKFFRGYSPKYGHTVNATWTRETDQDLDRLFGIDVEEELSEILTRELRNHIDQEMINTLNSLR